VWAISIRGKMKEILLSQGKVALVDDNDFEWLNQWNWCISQGYAVRHKNPSSMGRLILDAPDGMQVDHKNGDPLDNRRENLRLATQADNQHNRAKFKTNKSGYKGVDFHCKKWRAQIKVDNVKIYLGTFETAEEAACAYDDAAKSYFGRFANTNFA
jgi:hypothetical protein